MPWRTMKQNMSSGTKPTKIDKLDIKTQIKSKSENPSKLINIGKNDVIK